MTCITQYGPHHDDKFGSEATTDSTMATTVNPEDRADTARQLAAISNYGCGYLAFGFNDDGSRCSRKTTRGMHTIMMSSLLTTSSKLRETRSVSLKWGRAV